MFYNKTSSTVTVWEGSAIDMSSCTSQCEYKSGEEAATGFIANYYVVLVQQQEKKKVLN